MEKKRKRWYKSEPFYRWVSIGIAAASMCIALVANKNSKESIRLAEEANEIAQMGVTQDYFVEIVGLVYDSDREVYLPCWGEDGLYWENKIILIVDVTNTGGREFSISRVESTYSWPSDAYYLNPEAQFAAYRYVTDINTVIFTKTAQVEEWFGELNQPVNEGVDVFEIEYANFPLYVGVGKTVRVSILIIATNKYSDIEKEASSPREIFDAFSNRQRSRGSVFIIAPGLTPRSIDLTIPSPFSIPNFTYNDVLYKNISIYSLPLGFNDCMVEE